MIVPWFQRLLRALALLAVIALAGCAGPGDSDGIGGTGVHAQAHGGDDGIGGTGVARDPDGVGGTGTQARADDGSDGIGGTGIARDPDGIGGTGLRAWLDPDGIGGTGIVGEVTALGSIRIGDLHIEVPTRAVITMDGTRATGGDLVPGQIVAVLADTVDGRIEAREVVVRHALVGPVAGVRPGNGTLDMMGMPVRIEPGRTVVGAALGSVASIVPGDRLRVSGLWRDATLVVTRIDRAAESQPDSVYAPVSALLDGGARAGGLIIRKPRIAPVGIGRYVVASGAAGPTGLRANRFTPQPKIPFQGRIRRLIVEGFAMPGERGVRIGPLAGAIAGAASLQAGIGDAIKRAQRVVVLADIRGGRAEIRKLKPVRPPPVRPGAGALRPLRLPLPSATAGTAGATAPTPVPDRPAATAASVPALPQAPVRTPQADPVIRVAPAPTPAPQPVTPGPIKVAPTRPVAVDRTDVRVSPVDAVRALPRTAP